MSGTEVAPTARPTLGDADGQDKGRDRQRGGQDEPAGAAPLEAAKVHLHAGQEQEEGEAQVGQEADERVLHGADETEPAAPDGEPEQDLGHRHRDGQPPGEGRHADGTHGHQEQR